MNSSTVTLWFLAAFVSVVVCENLSQDDREFEKPGVQAYGLPKKHLLKNGVIDVVPVPSAITKRFPRKIYAYGLPKRVFEDNGFIERTSLDGTKDVTDCPSQEDRIPSVQIRGRRSLENFDQHISREDELEANRKENRKFSETDDLLTDETKVFRPLFAYRQQVAKRQQHRDQHKSKYNYNHKKAHQMYGKVATYDRYY